MKLKNYWKRFWTLDRHTSAGFTLVELIVVIAILAILAGVGIPVYSGYITKANKQADMTLISEIEHALTLAYYNRDLTDGDSGFLILSPNEGESMDDYGNTLAECTNGGPTALALEKSFGGNWMNAMQLKHNAWEVKNMTVSYADATAVVNSNFVQKYSQSELMAQVQIMTTAANGLNLQLGDTTVKLYDMFGYTDANNVSQNTIKDVMEEYGIKTPWNDLTETQRSNILVLATAASITNSTPEKSQNDAAEFLPQYAMYTALAAENPEFNKEYQKFQDAISNITTDNADEQYDLIKNAYKTLRDTADSKYNFQDWAAANGNNMTAFKAIMAGVGNAMKDNSDTIIADLNNPNMFTTGVGSELYSDYLSSAYTMAYGNELLADLDMSNFPGCVFVQYAVVDGEIYLANTLPAS